MVAGSISDSQLFHGSPVSRDFVKKRKANWLWKLKQWKIDVLRRQWIYQWKRANAGEVDENCCARLRSLRDKPPDIKAASDRFSYLQAWSIDHHHDELGRSEFANCDDDSDDDETLSASSPTSVLKNKDSDGNKSADDCFCCSRPITEEEEDAFEDALNSFDKEDNENPLQPQQDAIPNTSASQSNKSSPPANLIHNDKCKQEASAEKASHHEVSTNENTKSDQKEEGDDEIRECPICSEMMDETDLEFPTCVCGFQLCLFCRKKIYEESDRRCPYCREPYKEESSNSGEVSVQQRGDGTIRLSSSFEGLETDQ